MKRLLIFLLLTLPLIGNAQQKKVAVYVTGEDAGINKVLGSKLVSAIARSNEYSAIERTESFLAELSKEQSYQRTGAVDDSELSRLGKQFGVQYICVAAVSEAFGEKYLSARLIDVETAQVERTASSSGAIQSLDGIVSAANSVSNDLLSSLGKGRQSNLKKVAVYVVKNEAGRHIGRVLGDKLVAGFTNSGRYIAIERTNSFLAQLSKEYNYQHSGAVDDSEISRLGKQFGVQYVCIVEASDVFGEKYVSARLIDVETAEVVNTHDIGGVMNNMRRCLEMTNEIADVLSQVTIAELSLERKRIEQEGYVDLGLPSGTCWKKFNLPGKYHTEDAINKYEKYIPTQKQFTELTENCQFVGYRNGFRVVGPNGNYFFLETNKTEDSWFGASYLSKTPYEEEGVIGGIYALIVNSDQEETYGSVVILSKYDKQGVILCQQVDAFAKRRHDNRSINAKKKYSTLYELNDEIYCDGTYMTNGNTFATNLLPQLDVNYFKVSFSFKALSYEGTIIHKYGTESKDKQYPLVFTEWSRALGICLHNDGTIFIETNNGNHAYDTGIKYIPNQYCEIELEYCDGWLTINGKKFQIEMDVNRISSDDKTFHSINYSSGISFKGYLKDIKIYNVTNNSN